MDKEEKRVKHLELVQAIINRMAQNSFSLKTWTVTLASALFALTADKSNPIFLFVSFIPVFSFWVLDGYFLWQERLYRKLYDLVRTSTKEPDFSMDTAPVLALADAPCWTDATFSKTLLIFYGVIIATIIIIMYAITKHPLLPLSGLPQ